MRIATLFSGIGAPEQGAKRVYGDNLEMVFACEFDKFARQSFEANYEIEPEHFHVDVHDLDGTQYRDKVDILIGGSPCQAFSIAGLREGTEDERGQLIYQYIRVVEECMPPVIVYENVKGMMSITGGRTIKEFVQALRDIGYYCHYEVINTKDYGVPQNRERLFLVGFLDHDVYHRFEYAPKVKLEKRLKDVLEDEVDEKYYLNRPFEQVSYKKSGVVALHTDTKFEAYNRVYGVEGASPALISSNEPKIQVPSATKSGYETATTGDSINLSVPNSKTRRGRVGKQVAQTLDTACNQAVVEPMICASRGRNPDNPSDRTAGNHVEQRIEVNTNGTSNALTCVQKDNYVLEPTHRIRKLTPRECLRLQDFPDTFKIVVSDSQAYKQAGNSMSVNILEMIFNQIENAKAGECKNSLLDFIGA